MYLKDIHSLTDISDQYKAVICDVWGVLHDGVQLNHEAISVLQALRDKDIQILLLTNAPKCSDIIQERFFKMGAQKEFWDFTVTSGDVVKHHILSHGTHPNIFHWGKDDDKGLYDGMDIHFVSHPKNADLIVCTGLMISDKEVVSKEAGLLQEASDAKIPLLCANPDRMIKRGSEYLLCAGTIADIYTQLGGLVQYCGKPFKEVYDYSFHHLRKKTADLDLKDVLAIGDGLHTDIKGAYDLGMDSLFILDGVHGSTFKSHDYDFTVLRETCEGFDVMPEYMMRSLR